MTKSNVGHFTGWQTPTVKESICRGERCLADAEEGETLCAKCNKRKAAKRLISRPGYHWVFLVESQGKVRVGHATNLKLSLGALMDSCPSEVKLLVAFEAHKSSASDIREKFEDQRAGGRWFHLSDDMLDFVSMIEKGHASIISRSATGRVLRPTDLVDSA